MKKFIFFLMCLSVFTTSSGQDHASPYSWLNINTTEKFYDYPIYFHPSSNARGSANTILTGYHNLYDGPGLIYRDGLVWGGLVRDGELPVKRVGGTTNNEGELPGGIENGEPFDWNEPLWIYRYRKDWQTMSDSALRADAADIFNFHPEEVTSTEKAIVYEQYALYFNEWPAPQAPLLLIRITTAYMIPKMAIIQDFTVQIW